LTTWGIKNNNNNTRSSIACLTYLSRHALQKRHVVDTKNKRAAKKKTRTTTKSKVNHKKFSRPN